MPNLALDIRYATSDNFTKKIIYPCARCFVRPEVAEAIYRVLLVLRQDNLGLAFFDCYRPSPAQERLWEAYPDRRFVAPPAKGSMHSRGVAVDISLIDAQGNLLDMGTLYDYFGKEAAPSHIFADTLIMHNRSVLKNAMESHGFIQARSEWWHFSYKNDSRPLDSWEWACK